MPQVRALLGSALFAALALLAPAEAAAQSSYRMSPVGGRTTLVGGTGLVYGHDSASAFLNPGTVVRVDSNRLSFSVDFYYLSLLQSSSWYQPGTIDRATFGDVRREDNTAVSAFDFDSLPGSICLYFRIADLPFLVREAKKELRERQARLGVCLASVQWGSFAFNAEDYEQKTPTGVSRQAHNVRQTFRRLAFGPTYSMYVSNALAIGASLHFTRSSHRSLFGATATTFGGPRGPIDSQFYEFARGDSHDLTATFGAFYRLGSHQTVALALELPSVHLFGSGGLNYRTQYSGGAGSASSTLVADGSFATQTPLRIGLGTGIEQDWGTAELNVGMYLPVGSAYAAEFDGRSFDSAAGAAPVDATRSLSLSTRARGAVNVGVGGEVFLTPRISLLGGLSSDMTIVPKGTLKNDLLNFYPSRMHRVALSFGVGSHGEGGDLLIGSEMSYGWGERLTPNMYQLPPGLDVTDQKMFGFLFVLAGSTSFKSIKRAVEDVTKALDTKEKPTPDKTTGPATTYEQPAPEPEKSTPANK